MAERNARNLSSGVALPVPAGANPLRPDKELCVEADDSVRYCLRFHIRGGASVLFPHSGLLCASCDPKGGALTIHFSTHEVRIKGENLGFVLDAVSRGVNVLLREGDPSRRPEYREAEPFISQIEISEREAPKADAERIP